MDFIDIAVKAAKQAGKVHKRYFQSDIEIKTKTSSYDLLTIADTESERAAVSIIKKHFPDHNILAEEKKYEKTGSEFTWIIDPLDGTNNFASGLPIFCASVALAKKDEVIAGAIYDVTRDELFFAQKNKGAFLNDKKISVDKIKNLEEAILITGFYYDRGKKMSNCLKNVERFLRIPTRGLRRLGAAALDLCYIASGRSSGFWEFCLNPWDFCAGKLIVEEAGGKVTDNKAKPLNIFDETYIVASNGKIHQAMLKILNSK